VIRRRYAAYAEALPMLKQHPGHALFLPMLALLYGHRDGANGNVNLILTSVQG
jgi:hypothetical protein